MHVAVTSEHALVAQAVATALAREGTRTSVIPWPRTRSVAPMPRAPLPAPFDAGLLLSGLDLWVRVRAARTVMAGVPTCWVVLTEAPPGPLWGAALEYGAATVLPVEAALVTVVAVLEQAVSGEQLMPAAQARGFKEQWAEIEALHEETQQRFESLTPREREVLWHLYRGNSAGRIAAMMEVSLSTVRSQVKSVLRKLQVNSQLGAVATMRDFLELDPPRLPLGSDADDPAPPLGLRS